jgi:hypothetical protein
VTTKDERRGALDAVDRLVNRGGEADDVLRGAVAALSRLYEYVGFRFVERGGLVAGPSLGTRPDEPETWPVSFQGMKVAELEVAAPEEEDRAFLERVALLLSPYCLVGWDTGGEPWQP